MSKEVVDALGASCPDDGTFYVCENKPVRFVGCCTVDPCKTDDGVCPDDNLRAASFDPYSYNQFKPQQCVSDAPEVRWFTCAELETPFMGCCSANPCAEDGCHGKNVSAARLSDDDKNAAIFLPEDHDSGSGGGLSTGATVGIAVGAVVAGLLLIGGLAWWFLKRRKRQQEPSRTYEPYANQQQLNPTSPPPMGSPMDRKHSPYASTFSSSTTPNPQSYHHPQQYNQQLHQSQHQHQLSWDGSQAGGFSYQSPNPQQGTFSPSPYTSGTDVSGYAQALGVALANGGGQGGYQQVSAPPAQELPGGMVPVSELGASDDTELRADKKP